MVRRSNCSIGAKWNLASRDRVALVETSTSATRAPTSATSTSAAASGGVLLVAFGLNARPQFGYTLSRP